MKCFTVILAAVVIRGALSSLNASSVICLIRCSIAPDPVVSVFLDAIVKLITFHKNSEKKKKPGTKLVLFS